MFMGHLSITAKWAYLTVTLQGREVEFDFLNFACLMHVINKKQMSYYIHNKLQPNPCTCERARSKGLKFPVLN